jgi:hypothetical protein
MAPENAPVLRAVATSTRPLYQLLRCINFTPRVHVQITQQGIRFAADHSRVMQGAISSAISVACVDANLRYQAFLFFHQIFSRLTLSSCHNPKMKRGLSQSTFRYHSPRSLKFCKSSALSTLLLARRKRSKTPIAAIFAIIVQRLSATRHWVSQAHVLSYIQRKETRSR